MRTNRFFASSSSKLSSSSSSSYCSTTSAVAAAAFLATPRCFKSDWLQSRKILVTGANGQIGSELIGRLRDIYGKGNVVATDVYEPVTGPSTPFRLLNALDRITLEKIVLAENIGTILHLAAVMSVKGEERPHLCMELGIDSCENMFEVARMHNCRLYIPSSIAAFSPESGKHIASDSVHQDPTTIYGITKVFAEKIGTYYFKKWNTDFRSLRYPGIISAGTQPGGGTTDYAVWMYHYALQGKKYTCPVAENEYLPMMYMPDCLDATIEMLEAPRENLHKCVYNLAAMSFCPKEVAASIKKVVPEFEVEYQPDQTQKIAESWPDSMNDECARRDLKWQPKYDLDKMTVEMLDQIRESYRKRGPFKL